MVRRIMAVLCLLCLMTVIPVMQARAAETEEYVGQLISYYRYYQQDAAGEIRNILDEMEQEDPEEAARWTEIMEKWRWINEQMPVRTGVLPEGLPEDDSLCIVVMGFKLESSGNMKPELIHRLEAALASAQRYPNAILVCTGGATSKRSDVTEAEQMKKWLISAGVDERRIVTETRAANTPENARYVYKVLQQSHPQVSHVALITSDYHIYRSMILFFAEARLKDLPYTVEANAVCATEMAGEKELEKQARNLAELADVTLSEVPEPELPVPETEPVKETEPTTAVAEETVTIITGSSEDETEPSQPSEKNEAELEKPGIPVFALAGFGGALVLALILLGILLRIVWTKRI